MHVDCFIFGFENIFNKIQTETSLKPLAHNYKHIDDRWK